MPGVGGSIESVGLDGREFEVAADAEAQRKLGGFENEVQSNGGGGARIIKTRVALKYDGLVIVIDDSRGDQEFLQELADRTDFFPITVTHASGITYQGEAMITGENPASTQNATAPVTLEGPGQLTKI